MKITREEIASILTELGTWYELDPRGHEYSEGYIQGWHEALEAVERQIEEREAQQLKYDNTE